MIRKYRLKAPPAEARDAVMNGLLPILRSAEGFHAYWSVECTDGDIAGISIFETKALADAATDKTLSWVEANIRHLVELPLEAMFGGEAYQLA